MNAEHLLERYYFGRPDFTNGTTQFVEMCRRYIPQASRILEIGAGGTNTFSETLAQLGPVVGADVTDEVKSNRHLAQAFVYDGVSLPFEPQSFDACASNFVLEHVAEHRRHFEEVARVLKPNGVYCFRTPNLWHYVTLASRFTPHAVHLLLGNRLRKLAADAHAPYQTFYRANTSRRIRQLCREAGLDIVQLDLVEKEPSYGMAHPLLFLPMMLYERAVNSTDLLQSFRSNLFGVVRRVDADRQ